MTFDSFKVFNSKTLKVYKDKKLNSADFGEYSLTDYQVFLQLISKLGGVDEVGKYLQPEKLERQHVLTAKEFSETFNVDIYNSYRYLKKAVDKLMKTIITLEKTEFNQPWKINVCSGALYNKGEGKITIEFTDRIMPYLAQVKEKFVLYNLKEVASFRSLYTTRIYELIQEFKETGWLLKSIDQLRKILGVGNKFKTYNNFKQKTFNHACAEINKIYGLDLQFEEMKEGRKVVAIKFTFNKTKIHKAIHPKTGKTMNIYERPKPKHNKNTNKSKEVVAPYTEKEQMVFSDLPESTKSLESVLNSLATKFQKN